MFEFARYYGRRRVKGSIAMTVGFTVLIAMYVYMFPSISGSIDFESYVEAIPPAMRAAFGIQALGTIEGFLAAELYAFGWVLILGVYFAYAAAGLIADDVERGRMDMLLSLPVSRSTVLLEKYASLLVPLVVVNVITPIVVYVGVLAIGETLSVQDLVVVHLLSVPYLLSTASVGLLASVAVDRVAVAQRVGAGVVFGLFLVESVTVDTDFEAIGAIAPTRHYEPTAVLVSSEYNLLGAVILFAGAIVLVAASVVLFQRKDIS